MDTDFALLIIRLALGPMLVAHGYNKVFGAGGLAGTTAWFEALGLRPAAVHARLGAATEVAAGLAMTLGLLTPLVSAAFIGLMTVAALTDHRGKGFFVFKGGWEYTVIIAMLAAAIASTGPGEWSLDHLLGLASFHGWGWAVGAAGVGVLAGLALIAVATKPELRTSEQMVQSADVE